MTGSEPENEPSPGEEPMSASSEPHPVDPTPSKKSAKAGAQTVGKVEGAAGESAQADLVGMAEALADRTLTAFASKVDLPDVRAEAANARAFFRSIDSWAVWTVLLSYLCAAGAGIIVVVIGVKPIGILPDWYMHVAMYLVTFSFLVLYLRAHQVGHRIRQGVWAVLTGLQQVFFGWILLDRIEPRTLIVVTDELPYAVERPAFGLLALPAWLLFGAAFALMLHWLVLARFRRKAAALVEPDDQDTSGDLGASGAA